MAKVKLNLVSGAVVEKPLVAAFLGNNNNYVVLDNEMNGSMGLPIILVSKLEGNKLVKIVDQNEWQIVKEYLKNIIAGNKVEFISVNSEMPADDIYYTQLTLPVPSFDALKRSYTIPPVGANPVEAAPQPVPASAPVQETTPNVEPVTNIQPEPSPAAMPSVEPVMSNVAPTVEPVANIQPEPSPVAMPSVEPVMPNIEPITEPVVNTEVAPEPVVMPSAETPAVNNVEVGPSVSPVVEPITPNVEPVANTMEDPMLSNPLLGQQLTMPNAEPVAEVSVMDAPIGAAPTIGEQIVEQPINQANDISNLITEEPVMQPVTNETTGNNADLFKEQKEAFMLACENMFDALVQKFQKELDDRK